MAVIPKKRSLRKEGERQLVESLPTAVSKPSYQDKPGACLKCNPEFEKRLNSLYLSGGLIQGDTGS